MTAARSLFSILFIVAASVGCSTATVSRVVGQAELPLPPASANVDQAAASDTVLVQEPALRSARKPDYSSGFRASKYRSNFFMLQSFNEAIGESYKCTVQLSDDGVQCALGTVVDSDGWILTKGSELGGNAAVECLLNDGREFAADVVATDLELDLALLKISATDLTCAQWDFSVPDQGRWLATTDMRSSVPTAIGVVSAGPINVPNQRAVLGVQLENPPSGQGALVTHVLYGSGAYEAGLREQDSIVELDGKKVNSRDHLLDLLHKGKGGQVLSLVVHRDDQSVEKRVRLMDLSAEMLDETEMEVNGPISARSTGFGRVFMHDSVILPNQCGGPIINLDGKTVGINIARAGRVCTYAIPADTLTPAIKRLMHEANAAAVRTVAKPVIASEPSVPVSLAP